MTRYRLLTTQGAPLKTSQGAYLLGESGTQGPTGPPPPPPPGNSPPPAGGYFTLTAPGAAFPTDAQAAAVVHYSTWEPRPQNNTANAVIVAQPVTLGHDQPDFDSAWHTGYLTRVTGNFSGTTDEIIQWIAAKWGLSDEQLRAQCVQESGWYQDTFPNAFGDYEPASAGHRVYDRADDPSPTSFSIIQCKWYFHPPIVALGGEVTASNDPKSSYPRIVQSTAFALDYYGAILRGVYDGHSTYMPGLEIWNSIGSWYSGGWGDAVDYIASVQAHLAAKAWLAW